MIQKNYLLAALAILDKNAKGYKSVVRIEPHRIVACNGPALIVIAVERAQCDETFHASAEYLRGTLKGATASEIDPGVLRFSRLRDDLAYPHWSRALVREVSGVAAQFDPAYLAQFSKAAKILTGSSGFVISHNGTDGAVINFKVPYVTGVLQPLRVTEVRQVSPAWAFE